MSLDVDALYVTHQPALLRWFARVAGPDAAPDLTHTTFLHVLRSAHQYQPQGQELAWLFAIARRVLLDDARARQRRPDVVGSFEEHLGAGSATDAGGPSHLRRLELGEALRALPDRQRAVMVERCLLDTSRAQTASSLGVTENAVAKLQTRAAANLRRQMDRSA